MSVFLIHVEAYDWNCPQHITPRFTAEEIREGMHAVEQRTQALEQENEALRKQLEQLKAH
jgi:predicted pyridoxine 5'-phosphate oxidase superfamily flavin-nucleotide-binding protein